jgi:hypothetical protein
MKRAATLYYALFVAAVAMMMFPTQGRAQFPRTSLIEEFTSATCKPCTTATPIINNIIKTKAGRVVSVRYHLNFPAPGDPWYAANSSHNLARRDYYGATSLPYGRLDGATTIAVTQQGEVQDKVEERLATESPIKIDVAQTREGDQFHVKVDITAGEAGLDGNYKLQVIAVEAHVHSEAFQNEPFNKETDFYDIMRTIIPGPDGTDVVLNPNQKKSFTFNYAPGNGWQPEEMYAVAFVQNDVSKSIVQAGASQVPASAPDDITPVHAGYSLGSSFPNPANGAAAIEYTLGAPEHVTLDLYAMNGEKVATFDQGMRTSGEHELRMNLDGIPAGVYTCTITAGTYRAARAISVVK